MYFRNILLVLKRLFLLNYIKMRLTEKQRIEVLMMIVYGERVRTQQEVWELFKQKYPNRPPISQATVSKIEHKFEQFGHVRDVPRCGRPEVDENQQLEVLLAVQDNQHVVSRQIARDVDIGKITVLKIFHKNKYHPYKMQVLQELLEGDFDRRL